MYIKKKLTRTNTNNNTRQGTVKYRRIFFGLPLRRTLSILTASYVVVSFFRFPMQRGIRLRLLKIRFANCYLPDCVPNNFWKQEINCNWIWSSPCFFLLKVCPLLWIFNLLFLCVLFVVLFFALISRLPPFPSFVRVEIYEIFCYNT